MDLSSNWKKLASSAALFTVVAVITPLLESLPASWRWVLGVTGAGALALLWLPSLRRLSMRVVHIWLSAILMIVGLSQGAVSLGIMPPLIQWEGFIIPAAAWFLGAILPLVRLVWMGSLPAASTDQPFPIYPSGDVQEPKAPLLSPLEQVAIDDLRVLFRSFGRPAWESAHGLLVYVKDRLNGETPLAMALTPMVDSSREATRALENALQPDGGLPFEGIVAAYGEFFRSYIRTVRWSHTAAGDPRFSIGTFEPYWEWNDRHESFKAESDRVMHRDGLASLRQIIASFGWHPRHLDDRGKGLESLSREPQAELDLRARVKEWWIAYGEDAHMAATHLLTVVRDQVRRRGSHREIGYLLADFVHSPSASAISAVRSYVNSERRDLDVEVLAEWSRCYNEMIRAVRSIGPLVEANLNHEDRLAKWKAAHSRLRANTTPYFASDAFDEVRKVLKVGFDESIVEVDPALG